MPVNPISPAELPVEHGSYETGNVLPLLNEIRHALKRFLESGEVTTIDLRSIPLAPGEEARLEDTLGEGEVTATLSALGPSEIRETTIPGVWWVTHLNENRDIIGKFIEITRIPSVLGTLEDDMRDGIVLLEQVLEGVQEN